MKFCLKIIGCVLVSSMLRAELQLSAQLQDIQDNVAHINNVLQKDYLAQIRHEGVQEDMNAKLLAEKRVQLELSRLQLLLIHMGVAWLAHSCISEKAHKYIQYISWTHAGIVSIVNLYRMIKIWKNLGQYNDK